MADSTNSLMNKTSLLVIMALLLLFRFVVMPVSESQSETQSELEMVQKGLASEEALLDSPLNEELVATTSADRKKLEQQFTVYEQESQFRLATQSQVEQIMKSNSVEVRVFTWLDSTPVVENYLYQFTAQIEIEGAITDIVQTQLDMINDIGAVGIKEFSLRPARRSFGYSSSKAVPRVRVSMVIELGGLKNES